MSFKNIVSDYKKAISYDGQTSKNEYENSYIDNFISSFYDNIAYTQVSKNFASTPLYDTWIMDGDTKDKEVPYKRLLSYPYPTIQFKRGDYIHFEYSATPTTWLLTTLEAQKIYDINGRIYLCNNNLKWLDSSGIVKSYPCVVKDRFNSTVFDYRSSIIIPDGTIYVDVQSNSDTNLIKENSRFLLGNAENLQAFKCTFVENFTSGNVITLTLVKDNIAPDDRNGIANADKYNNTQLPSGNLW